MNRVYNNAIVFLKYDSKPEYIKLWQVSAYSRFTVILSSECVIFQLNFKDVMVFSLA